MEAITAGQPSQPPKLLVAVYEGMHRYHPHLLADIRAYGDQYRDHFQLLDKILILPGGEAAKNDPELVEVILQEMKARGIDRHSYVLAVIIRVNSTVNPGIGKPSAAQRSCLLAGQCKVFSVA